MPVTPPPRADRWIEVSAQVAADDSDLLADVLREAGADGVVIEPALLISDAANFAYEELRDRPWRVRGYVPAPFEDARRGDLETLVADILPGVGALAFTEVAPEDWSQTWKQFYRVLHIGQRLVIRPSWEPYEAQAGEVVVDLDPGAAFGTGQHETTRLCLEAVEQYVQPGMDVFDIGAGSGLLAIAAVKLGAREVLCVDDDASTIAVLEENAGINGVADHIVAAVGSMGSVWPWADRPAVDSADMVLANISSTAVVTLMRELAAALRPDGLLVASGFIERDVGEVRAAAGSVGLEEVSLTAEGDWRCLVSRRATA